MRESACASAPAEPGEAVEGHVACALGVLRAGEWGQYPEKVSKHAYRRRPNFEPSPCSLVRSLRFVVYIPFVLSTRTNIEYNEYKDEDVVKVEALSTDVQRHNAKVKVKRGWGGYRTKASE